MSLSRCFVFFLFFLFLYFLLILIEDIATIGYGLDGVESLRPKCGEAQRLYRYVSIGNMQRKQQYVLEMSVRLCVWNSFE